MMALNASIEAARSGVEGSGFDVVAKKMKELADEAKASTARIRSILEDIQQAIENSAQLTGEAVNRTDSGKDTTQIAEHTIRNLTENVKQNHRVFQEIIHATTEQQVGIEQVTEGMHQVRAGAQQTSSSTEHVQQAAERLNVLAQELRGISDS